jgi:flagellar hook assembly protein FlgD
MYFISHFTYCQYSTEFLVKETCELMIQITTGMKVNDVEMPFLVYTNSLVNRMDIWIYNTWGQLIYSCSKDDLKEGERYCIWYGDFNGVYIQTGAYSVKISVKNNSDKAPKNFYRSLLVIE